MWSIFWRRCFRGVTTTDFVSRLPIELLQALLVRFALQLRLGGQEWRRGIRDLVWQLAFHGNFLDTWVWRSLFLSRRVIVVFSLRVDRL